MEREASKGKGKADKPVNFYGPHSRCAVAAGYFSGLTPLLDLCVRWTGTLGAAQNPAGLHCFPWGGKPSTSPRDGSGEALDLLKRRFRAPQRRAYCGQSGRSSAEGGVVLIAFVLVAVLAFVTVVTWMVRRAWRRAWDDLGVRATALGAGAGPGLGAWPTGTGTHSATPTHDTYSPVDHSSWWEAGGSEGTSSGCSSGSSSSCGSSTSSCGSSSSSCGSSSSSCGSSSSSCSSSC